MKLLRQGLKLEVLGLAEHGDKRFWHVARAGSVGSVDYTYASPQAGATSLCGIFIITNGYAADFAPPDGALCPRCAERR